ncbi:hypothetical protein BTA51_03300 [Hahella sp. CCB-MM4]|uniref:HAMP domain-containing sensor histidine kinase n=1 Tax=Hahella sp. (strain CCB-MM4) TaxID=1926491 RepID=UPI000B9AF76A|nr:HAMP domain-containing sensor histidine kinase [Hahella sp. CCB-MM4]OZG75413.1 hypothetical protein BTA51_03300 [Hahella sp. CCB-MM4]
MAHSVSQRVKRIFFWTYSVSVALVLVVAWWFLEDLEATTLEMDKQAEIEHFLNRHETDKIVRIQSAMLTLVYLPAGLDEVEELPIIFQGMPIPFEGEVDFLGQDYLVITNHIPEGTYFLAKDLSLFEHRESIMVTAMITLGGLAILISFILSVFISRTISKPLEQLTTDIRRARPSEEDARLPVTYKDAELNEISGSFNNYLDDIDHLIKRERSLVTMASHELRTPITVILGAAEVLQNRKRLHPDDEKTLLRISNAATTMSANIQALLTLVRQTNTPPSSVSFLLSPLLTDIINELAGVDASLRSRIQLETPTTEVSLKADRTMVRILLHNLISNALHHNKGQVFIRYNNTTLEVLDEGIKVAPQQASADTSSAQHSSGIGLYIVTLICDYLGWKFTLVSTPEGQTSVKVQLPASEAHSQVLPYTS